MGLGFKGLRPYKDLKLGSRQDLSKILNLMAPILGCVALTVILALITFRKLFIVHF